MQDDRTLFTGPFRHGTRQDRAQIFDLHRCHRIAQRDHGDNGVQGDHAAAPRFGQIAQTGGLAQRHLISAHRARGHGDIGLARHQIGEPFGGGILAHLDTGDIAARVFIAQDQAERIRALNDPRHGQPAPVGIGFKQRRDQQPAQFRIARQGEFGDIGL